MGVAVNALVFNPGASAFVITQAGDATFFAVSGAGVTNNSSQTQNFVIGGDDKFKVLQFMGIANAGASTTYTTNPNGNVWFSDSSSAGQATFINKAGSVSGGKLWFGNFFRWDLGRARYVCE